MPSSSLRRTFIQTPNQKLQTITTSRICKKLINCKAWNFARVMKITSLWFARMQRWDIVFKFLRDFGWAKHEGVRKRKCNVWYNELMNLNSFVRSKMSVLECSCVELSGGHGPVVTVKVSSGNFKMTSVLSIYWRASIFKDSHKTHLVVKYILLWQGFLCFSITHSSGL